MEISRFEDGRPAPVHLLWNLPADWGREFDAEGRIWRLSPEIDCGFVEDGRFVPARATASRESR
jgi:hypothetical protein